MISSSSSKYFQIVGRSQASPNRFRRVGMPRPLPPAHTVMPKDRCHTSALCNMPDLLHISKGTMELNALSGCADVFYDN